MNRTTKGAIAVGAATLLLLGGGGTFALWNTSQQVDAATVSSGELSLVEGDTAGWYNSGAFDAAHAAWLLIPLNPDPEPVLTDFPIADITTYHVVPEDELIYIVDDFSITAEGSNLFYTFESDVDPVDSAADGYTATVEILDGADLPGTDAAAGLSEYAGVATGTMVYSFNSVTAETVQFSAGLKVVFDANGIANFNSDLDLSALNFVLQQVVKS